MDRFKKAGEKYLSIAKPDMYPIDHVGVFDVYDDGAIVFVKFEEGHIPFEYDHEQLVKEFEIAAAKYLEDYEVHGCEEIRCDLIQVAEISDHRGLVKHYVNVLGYS